MFWFGLQPILERALIADRRVGWQPNLQHKPPIDISRPGACEMRVKKAA